MSDCNNQYYLKTQPTRFIDLIKHIFENKIESCNDLFNLFPGELIGGFRITKAHLFEALWKIVFFDEIHQGSGSDSMQDETI